MNIEERCPRRLTIPTDKDYEQYGYVEKARSKKVTKHMPKRKKAPE